MRVWLIVYSWCHEHRWRCCNRRKTLRRSSSGDSSESVFTFIHVCVRRIKQSLLDKIIIIIIKWLLWPCFCQYWLFRSVLTATFRRCFSFFCAAFFQKSCPLIIIFHTQGGHRNDTAPCLSTSIYGLKSIAKVANVQDETSYLTSSSYLIGRWRREKGGGEGVGLWGWAGAQTSCSKQGCWDRMRRELWCFILVGFWPKQVTDISLGPMLKFSSLCFLCSLKSTLINKSHC